MQAYLTGMGWLTAAGVGRGRGAESFSAPGGLVQIPSRRQIFQSPDDRFGRLDDFSKVGLAALAAALRDAGLETFANKRPVGIAASTQRGCLVTDLDFFHTVLADQGKWPSPHLFTYTLPSCFLGEAALRFGLTGPTYILHERQTFSLAGVRAALLELADGEADIMLAGACDVPWPDGPSPVPGRSEGAPGAAFVVLERSLRAESEPYATIQAHADNLLMDHHPLAGLDEMIMRASRGNPDER